MVYRNFFQATGGVKVEVAEDGRGTSSAYAPALFSVIEQMGAAMADQFAKLPDEARPRETEIAFALQALPTGGFAISQGAEAANFTVRMLWTNSGGKGPASGSASPGLAISSNPPS